MQTGTDYTTNKTLNKTRGNIGEAKAVNYLKKLGYKILLTNFKTKLGEIDIIAKDGERIVFVEVKARATARYGYPREAITTKKQQTIRRVAEIYLLKTKNANAYTRFDVIEVLAEKIAHIQNAF